MGKWRQYSVLFHMKDKYFGITNGELEGKENESESHSVMSDSLRPHGPYSP